MNYLVIKSTNYEKFKKNTMTDRQYYLICAITAFVILIIILTFYYNYCYNQFLIIESVKEFYIKKGVEFYHF